MFDLGIQELIVIFVVALVVFGPKRLPELGRTLGKGILELKKAMEGVREQIHAESEMIQKETELPKPEEKKTGEGPEPGSAAETNAGVDDMKEQKEGTRDLKGAQETDKFYRAGEESAEERKEGSVDGR